MTTTRRPGRTHAAWSAVLAVVLALLAPVAGAGAGTTSASAGPVSTSAGPESTSAGPTGAGAASARPVVSLRSVRDAVVAGAPVRLRGRTRAPRGSKVRIQLKKPRRAPWRDVGRATVRKQGRFRHAVTPATRGTHRFRACVRTPRVRCTRAVKVRVRPRTRPPAGRVQVVRASGTYDVGDRVRVTGTASPDLVGRVAQLQETGGTDAGAPPGVWTTIGSARVAADGSLTLAGRLPAAGRSVSLRVRVPAPTSVGTDVLAPAGAVEVFGWYYLRDRGAVAEAAGRWCPLDDRTVAGQAAPRSIGFGINCNDLNEAEVALQRRCRTFRARVGLSDAATDTTPNVRYAARFYVDGTRLFHQPSMVPGEAYAAELDLRGARRLRLEVPFVSGTQGLVVVGGARVECAL